VKTTQGKKSSSKEDWTLNHIQKLYDMKQQINDKTALEYYQAPQEKICPYSNSV
jgi:hypothetical protein